MTIKKAFGLAFIILVIDQVSKIYIKTNFALGTVHEFASWFQINFLENEGMAWGIEIPGKYGKLFLTLFRIVAVGGIAWWLQDSIKKMQSNYLIIAIALIFAGALGNIIDSVFYGVIFNESVGQVATAFSNDPYGTWFYGRVVDMLYFPIFSVELPNWLQDLTGQHTFSFFNAVFNVADVAISSGFGILLVFNKKCFKN
jgi:signal peptidase II